MTSTAELLVKVTADASQATSAMSSFGAEIQKIGSAAAGMATGILAANLTMGLADRFTSAAEQIDKFGQSVLQIQRITGESAESSSMLLAIFEKYAPSVDEATGRLAKFEKALAGQEDSAVSAAAGGKRVTEYLAEFGVQATDASGKLRPTTDILLDLAEGFKNSGDAAQKNAALVALFGRGSQDMMLMLNQGKAGLQEFMDQVKQYGLVLTDENVKDVQAFVFAHRDMDMALQGVSLQLGAAFMPSVTAAAQATASFAQAINSTVMPAIRAFADLHIDWLIPATSGALLLGGAVQVLSFLTAPLTGLVTGLATAIAGQGVASAATVTSDTALATAEAAVGTAAAAATPEVAALGAAADAAAKGGLFAAASTVAMLAGAVYQFSQPLRDDLDILHQMKTAMANVPDSAMNPLQKSAKTLLDAIPDIAAPRASTPPVATATPPGLPEESPGIKSATAAVDAAKAHVQDLNNDAANRQATFDMAHIDAQSNILNLQIQQSEANAAQLEYKRQIEDIDRDAINFAQQRLQLEEQRDVLLAQQSESSLKNQSDDRKYQEDLIKAQMAASRVGGPAVNADALRQQLADLRRADIQDQPGLLMAEHNTALANRAQSATNLQAGLDANAVAGQKLDVNEAMAPAQAAAVMATRALEDAQHLLDLDKQRFDLSKDSYETAKLLADATQRATEHTLFLLQHPDALPAPATAKEPGTVTGEPGLFGARTTATAPAAAGGGIQVYIGDVIHNGGQAAEDVWESIKGQFVAAWNAAQASHPVTGQVGGSFRWR